MHLGGAWARTWAASRDAAHARLDLLMLSAGGFMEEHLGLAVAAATEADVQGATVVSMIRVSGVFPIIPGWLFNYSGVAFQLFWGG